MPVALHIVAKQNEPEFPMIGRLNHVAIAVPDLEAAADQYRTALGANVGAPQDEPDHGVTVIFIDLPNTKIELLYPLGDNSPINGFLEKNPSGGIHHICYEVGPTCSWQRRTENRCAWQARHLPASERYERCAD
jgi:methylmalonyl-CoA epimerase